MEAGRNATMSRDEIRGAYIQGMSRGAYIQGMLPVLQELIEPAPAERAGLSAG